MADVTPKSGRRVDQVYEKLSELVSSPEMSVGTRLAPIRDLARRCGASVPTVQRAMARLEAEGRIDRRHGSGVYVSSPQRPMRLDQAVALCMEGNADVYGELTTLLSRGLQERGRFATLVDTTAPDYPSLIRGLSQTAVNCLMVHGHIHFKFELLDDPLFRRKPVIAVLDWETNDDTPQVWQVLVDYRAGARMMAAHLQDLGHRHVLFVGTSTQIWYIQRTEERANAARFARQEWEGVGGTWTALAGHHSPQSEGDFHLDELIRILDAPDAPTAVWGLRDLEAVRAYSMLQRHRPDLADRLTIVGCYDSVWSRAIDPPITSLNMNISELADRAVAVACDIADGTLTKPTQQLVTPILMVRESSKPAPKT